MVMPVSVTTYFFGVVPWIGLAVEALPSAWLTAALPQEGERKQIALAAKLR
jgi:hypothetical protein